MHGKHGEHGKSLIWLRNGAMPEPQRFLAVRSVSSVRIRLLSSDLIRVLDGPERAVEPVRSARAVGPGRGAGARHPFLVLPMRFVRVDADVAVVAVRSRLLDFHALVPAVHAADRIGLNGERWILSDSHFSPHDW